jgi:calcineurin-like phosphoesterase family protein
VGLIYLAHFPRGARKETVEAGFEYVTAVTMSRYLEKENSVSYLVHGFFTELLRNVR